MNISLGNLTINQLEERTGWEFSKEDFEWLDNHRTSLADFKEKDKLHIFDIPFRIVCGEEIINDVMSILTKYNNQNLSIESLQVAYK